MMRITPSLNHTQRTGDGHDLIRSAEAVQVVGPVEHRDSVCGPQQPRSGVDTHFSRPRPKAASAP